VIAEKPSSQKRRAFRGAAVLAFAGALLLAGCSRKQAPAVREAIPVMAATVAQKDIPLQVKAIGTVEAYSTVAVRSNVTGEITDVHFTEGQDVKKGQLIFTIDRRPFEAALNQAQANLARDAAQAQNAQTQSERYTHLVQQGVVSRDQADTYRTAAETAKAVVEADKAAVDRAKVDLSYCSIFSPIGGRTGNLMIHQGNLVKANDTPIMVNINQVTPIYVTFSIPEQSLSEVKKYMASGKLKVAAVIPNDPQPAEGQLSFVDNAVDTATGTIKLKGTFANEDRRLWPGQFVDAVLTLTTQPNAIVVPTQAVQNGQQGQFVFVVKPDLTVESRPITVSRAVDNQSIIQGGLQPGERVVTDGQLRLVPGAKVEIKNNPRAVTNGEAPVQPGAGS
jgi:multidrug efflux system membrane fusion protein